MHNLHWQKLYKIIILSVLVVICKGMYTTHYENTTYEAITTIHYQPSAAKVVTKQIQTENN